MHDHQAQFLAQGYLLLPGKLPSRICTDFASEILGEYARLHAAGWRFAESGRLSGHLNVRMGVAGRPLLAAFVTSGLPQLLEGLAGEPLILGQAVGNLNLPGSCMQDFHMDGAFDQRVFIANICLVPTNELNGATELVPRSDAAPMSYWRFARDGWRDRAARPAMQPGDVLIRPSNLWHRGTPNRSNAARPMAGLVWKPRCANDVTAGNLFSEFPDLACPDIDGPLTIHGNKYYGRWRRLKEFVAARLPVVDEALRQGSTLLRERST